MIPGVDARRGRGEKNCGEKISGEKEEIAKEERKNNIRSCLHNREKSSGF